MQELREFAGQQIAVFRLEGDDWELLRALRLAALHDSPLAFLGDPEAEAQYSERQWRSDLGSNVWMLGRLGDESVGLAKLNRAVGSDEDVHLEAMWVAPQARAAGVGARLLEAMEAAAVEVGSQRLCLWVFAENPAARDFYLRLGYAPTGRRQPIKVNDRGTIETEYAKQLMG